MEGLDGKDPSCIHSAEELLKVINKVGFLPLFSNDVTGFSVENMTDPSCWWCGDPDIDPWEWRAILARTGEVAYGKFFGKKAGFIAREWWPDFYNWRRATHPAPSPGSIEEAILMTLREHGSLITRELRAACGFNGPKMRSRFDGYVTRLQMACRIVTEDFVYPRDKHNHEYGWGWALLTTPEQLLGKEACHCDRTPEESLERMLTHLGQLLPHASKEELMKLIK